MKISSLVALAVAAAVAVGIPVGLGGCQPVEEMAASSQSQGEENTGPETALEEIYQSVEIRGIQEGTDELLEEKFQIDPSLYTENHSRVADGSYGVADVLILRPAEGKADELRNALELAKVSRITEFTNYDIYNSLELAQNGEIYEVGDYLVLTMIDNGDQVRSIIEQHILQQTTLNMEVSAVAVEPVS